MLRAAIYLSPTGTDSFSFRSLGYGGFLLCSGGDFLVASINLVLKTAVAYG